MAQDISSLLNGTDINLEQDAFDTFGAAVDTGNSSLSSAFSSSSSNSQNTSSTTGEERVWDPTHYASALVMNNQVEFNPKLKFLFKVSFEFDPSMIDAARRMGHDLTAIQQNFSFLIRHIDRPKFDMEYEEVNMYNFRTKILKKIGQREVGFTVYDDIGNNALSFVNLYRKLLQPIARSPQDPFMVHEDHGFAFDKTFSGLDTSMRGILPGGKKNILTKMTIHQIFVERGSTTSAPSSWVKVVDFVFINPRFTNIDIDDLDHENGGNFNIITISSDFDTMFMTEPFTFTQSKAGPNFPTGDISANSNTSANINPQGGTRNPFTDVISSQNSTFTNSGVSDLISGSSSSFPGGQLPITKLGGTSGVGGALQEAAKRTISGMTTNISQALARPTAALLRDSNTAPAVVRNLTSQVASNALGDFGDFI